MSFKGKVVVVTGSSQGIGKAMAWHFASQGAKVVLNARHAAKLDRTKAAFHEAGFDVIAVSGDISNWEDLQRLLDETLQAYGRIDALINNAATTTVGALDEVEPSVYERVFNVNLLGPVLTTKVFLPEIRKSKGSIIFISSLAALHGLPYHAAYSATKNALRSIHESLSVELESDGVHVGLAYVGFTENDPQKKVYNSEGEEVVLPNRKGIKKDTPEQVAARIADMIQRRKSSVVMTTQGKALFLLSRLAPRLIRLIYKTNLKQFQESAKL